MSFEKRDTKDLRKFGLMFCAVFLIISAISYFKEAMFWEWTIGISAFFLLTGLLFQQILRPVYVGWMKFASALGWFNTRLILGLVFYLIFTPIGIIMKLLGKDPLRLKFDSNASTYWIRKEQKAFDPKRYERLF